MYSKLFTKILDSSIWLESQPTRLVWITFLACMDQDGTVALSSVGNVANRARVSEDEAAAAIACLESPDLHNPDQEHEGRRIERIPGVGWIVLNAAKYRDLATVEKKREQTRKRVEKHRAQKPTDNADSGNAPVTQSNENVTPSEAEAEAEADTQTTCVRVMPLKAVEPEPDEVKRFTGRGPKKDLGGAADLHDIDDLGAFGVYRDAVEDWYCSAMGTLSFVPNAATATQITWLYENKFTLDEITAFYKHAKGEGWRQGTLNLGAIVKGIAEWRADKRGTNGAEHVVDFSWCELGCDPKTGLIPAIVDGKSAGMMKCKHRGVKAA